MKVLLVKIFTWLLERIGDLGCEWAKNKYKEMYANHKELEDKRSKRLKRKLLKYMKSHEPRRPYNLDISVYGRRVEKLLKFTRDRLCDGIEMCKLIGTTTVLPSAMVKDMSLYQGTWKSHGDKVKGLAEKGEYKAYRVVCVAHRKLLDDVKVNSAAYNEYFEWCEGSCIETRIFDGDYISEVKKNGILLIDYMLFSDLFVFGSANSITEKEIETYLFVDDDDLYKYKIMAKEVLRKSVEVKDIKSLKKHLNEKLRE